MQVARTTPPPGAPPLVERGGGISRRSLLYCAIGVTGLTTLVMGGLLVSRLIHLAHPASSQGVPPAISSSPGDGEPESTATSPQVAQNSLVTLAPGLRGASLTSIDWSPDGKRVAAAFSDGH